MVCFLMFFEDSISAGAGDGLSSEAAAKAGLVVPDFCLFPAFHRGMVLTRRTHNFRRRTPIDTL